MMEGKDRNFIPRLWKEVLTNGEEPEWEAGIKSSFGRTELNQQIKSLLSQERTLLTEQEVEWFNQAIKKEEETETTDFDVFFGRRTLFGNAWI